MSQSRSKNQQLFLNLITNTLTYVLGLGVTFFLTPYIVSKLGTSSYGFIGLTNNIISYSMLLTVALNSMAGRYITLHYHKGNLIEANGYFSSTFYGNAIIGCILFSGLGIITIFLDKILNIPSALVEDVRTLFILLAVNTIFGLITSIYSLSTFIKNRIDQSNIRSTIGTILRSGLLILLFCFFKPRLWYFGVTAIVMSLYIFLTNLQFHNRLTPDLILEFKNFKFQRVWEIMKSGMWNLLSSLSNLIYEGLDLLLANLFISPIAMGWLALTKTIPTYIISFIASLVGSFNPQYIKLYAEGKNEELKQELLKACRLLGFISTTLIAIMFTYGDWFYKNWLPTENAQMLYYLCIVGISSLAFTLPYQSLWYVFTIQNKLKRTSINALENALLSFLVVIICMFFVKDDVAKLFILIGVRAITSSFRCLTFLPLYAAKVMNFPRITFYKPILLNLLMLVILTAISFIIKDFITIDNWSGVLLGAVSTAVIGVPLGIGIMLNKSDKKYLKYLIRNKLHLNSFS